MVKSDTYQIIDATGWRLAEISFHRAISEELHPVYLQDICESMQAAGYCVVDVPELSEFGQLIAE
tara:strand:+ start:1015 stop:1209 length:195 start_codon:yes stop_codon:yes gene_type:complete